MALKIKKNPLNENIHVFFDKVKSIKFTHFQVKAHLQKRKKAIENAEWGGTGSNLIIGDLTGPSDNGSSIHYSTGFKEWLNIEETQINITTLISMDGMRSLAHCYEALETLMLDLLAGFLSEYPEYSNVTGTKVKSEIKKSIRSYYKKRSNEEMLKTINRISKHFAEHAEELYIREWYRVLSHVRHGIVHSFYKVDISKFKNQEKCLNLFNNHFENEPTDNDNFRLLKMNNLQAEREMTRCAEFGFFLFKSLSIEGGYDWQILKN